MYLLIVYFVFFHNIRSQIHIIVMTTTLFNFLLLLYMYALTTLTQLKLWSDPFLVYIYVHSDLSLSVMNI